MENGVEYSFRISIALIYFSLLIENNAIINTKIESPVNARDFEERLTQKKLRSPELYKTFTI